MTLRKQMSQVKNKVRRAVLRLQEDFSLEQLVAITGENPNSVRTELQRMREHHLVTLASAKAENAGPGRPRDLYRLADDPGVRQRIWQSLEAYEEPTALNESPQTPEYSVAQRLLDRAMWASDPEREKMLKLAAQHLSDAREDERADEPVAAASASVRSYLDYEAARLNFLCGAGDKALALFRQVRPFFERVNDHCRLEYIDEAIIILEMGLSDYVDPLTTARHLQEYLTNTELSPGRPLLVLMAEAIDQLLLRLETEMVRGEEILPTRHSISEYDLQGPMLYSTLSDLNINSGSVLVSSDAKSLNPEHRYEEARNVLQTLKFITKPALVWGDGQHYDRIFPN